jgi:hypothetical protein
MTTFDEIVARSQAVWARNDAAAAEEAGGDGKAAIDSSVPPALAAFQIRTGLLQPPPLSRQTPVPWGQPSFTPPPPPLAAAYTTSGGQPTPTTFATSEERQMRRRSVVERVPSKAPPKGETRRERRNRLARDAPDLFRLTYMTLDESEVAARPLGYFIDSELSTDETRVFIYAGKTGRSVAWAPVVMHRGSITREDWLVSDTAIVAGTWRTNPRHLRAREVVRLTEAKYGVPADSGGHSLGGHLAQHSGARGAIVTGNGASFLVDDAPGEDQIDLRAEGDIVSLLASKRDQARTKPLPSRPEEGGWLQRAIRRATTGLSEEAIDRTIVAHSVEALEGVRRNQSKPIDKSLRASRGRTAAMGGVGH